MVRCLSRLISTTPRELWVDLAATADAAFAEAVNVADRYVEEPERMNMMGQLRHARLEAGWRRDAKLHGLNVLTPHTNPKGGRYSVATKDGIYILRSNVQAHLGPPRPSKFRQQFAALNSWLSPRQTDFFQPVEEPETDRLCAMLIVTAQARGNPALPAWVGVGFPHQHLTTWAEIASVSEILAMYHDVDTDTGHGAEPALEIRDIAVPTIKRRTEG